MIRNLEKEQSLFKIQVTQDEAVVEAGLVISHITAKNNNSFSDGEYIKEFITKACEIISPKTKDQFEKLSLSRRTVVRRIENIA